MRWRPSLSGGHVDVSQQSKGERRFSLTAKMLEEPGHLIQDGRAVVLQYFLYHYNILSESGGMPPLPEWMAYHHENLDGNGYPFTLDASGLLQV